MTNDRSLKRIMYVDDDPDLRNIVRLGLEKGGGFTVKVCGSGRQAIREIPGFQPDLILLDVVMPDMNGPGTLELMRSMPELPLAPVVFLTSIIEDAQLQQYKKMGALGVIKKPLEFRRLAEQVRMIWEKFISEG